MSIQLTNVKIPNLFSLPKLSIADGEKVLIQGPSGKGKTTLLHLIGGILRPPEGQVQVQGQKLYEMNDNELSLFRRQKIGLIYQKLNLIDHLTTLENLELIAAKKDPSQSEALLQKLQLTEAAGRKASVLSLGEQQRVAIGRVLLQQPEIWLADEPTSSLDRANAEKVMGLILEASQGKTLVVVSHDERIEKYFDRILSFTEIVR